MAEYAVNLNNGKTDEKGIFRLIGRMLTNSGVIGSASTTALQVAAQGSPDMTVKVSGSAVGDEVVIVTSTGDTYHGWNTANSNVNISSNSSGVTKKDTVIAYIDTAAGSATANNPGALKFLAVRGSGTNTAPTDGELNTATSNKPWLRLADITVANGASSINSGNITDVRISAWIHPKLFGTNNIPGSALVTVTTTSTLNVSLNDGTVTSFSSALRTGSAANGTYHITGTVNISSLGVPASATVVGYQFWCVGVGNTNNQGAVACAVTSFSPTSVTMHCQIAGNDAGFPNLTNSKFQGYVRYIA